MPYVRTLSVTSCHDAERELCALGIDSFQIPNHLGKFLHNVLLLEGVTFDNREKLNNILASCSVATVVGQSEKMVIVATDAELRKVCASLEQSSAPMPQIALQLMDLLNKKNSSHEIWSIKSRTLKIGIRPHVMGILNVTPDSFSDGGRFTDIGRAVDHALQLEADGADIIDIGGESTRPSASPVDENEELQRVIPVIERLVPYLKIPISIDTYKGRVAKEALQAGAEIVNDISGLAFDGTMADVVAGTEAGVILMHTRGMPQEMQNRTSYANMMSEILQYLASAIERASSAGVKQERIVIDPGLGFGKDLSGNLEILRRLSELKVLGRPILVGTSRKAFIGKILGRDSNERMFGTAATVAVAMMHGARLFRVHDVRATRDVVDIVSAIENSDMQSLSKQELQ